MLTENQSHMGLIWTGKHIIKNRNNAISKENPTFMDFIPLMCSKQKRYFFSELHTILLNCPVAVYGCFSAKIFDKIYVFIGRFIAKKIIVRIFNRVQNDNWNLQGQRTNKHSI